MNTTTESVALKAETLAKLSSFVHRRFEDEVASEISSVERVFRSQPTLSMKLL